MPKRMTRLSLFCCSGPNSSPDPSKSALYFQFFKNAHPQAYSYAYDDGTHTTYTCASPSYQITFFPDNTMVSSRSATYLLNSTNMTVISGDRTVIMGNDSQPSPGDIMPSPSPGTGPNIASRRNWAPVVAGLVGGLLVTISLVVVVLRGQVERV